MAGSAVDSFAMTGGRLLPEALIKYRTSSGALASTRRRGIVWQWSPSPAARASRGTTKTELSAPPYPCLIPWAVRNACTGLTPDGDHHGYLDPQGFAERLRAHLEHHNLILKHGQALDLIAAIPGLRNWPEVNAFPERVAVAKWDDHSAHRLVKRIAKAHSLILSADELGRALTPSDTNALAIWPDGPVAGLYITTSQAAVDAAMAQYETASHGALIYAEAAGGASDAAIDLGDNGLFSRGMERLPSGTLVVIGPLPLTQESWSDNENRLNAAANLAYSASIRVVVLVETPLPENLHSDIDLMLRPDGEGLDSDPVDVLGIVTESGDLQVVKPFVKARVHPTKQSFITDQRLPQELEEVLTEAVAKRTHGVVVLGVFAENIAGEALLEATVPLTDHAGPAVRIQPTFRAGYGRDDRPLSPYFKSLPIFPSIESAYAHGFRRMVIESPHYGDRTTIIKHAHDVCFLIHSHLAEVNRAWSICLPDLIEDPKIIDTMIAVLCMAEIPTKSQTEIVCDAFMAGEAMPADSDISVEEFIEANRAVRWQDQLDRLLSLKKVTMAQAKKALRRHDMESYLLSRKGAKPE